MRLPGGDPGKDIVCGVGDGVEAAGPHEDAFAYLAFVDAVFHFADVIQIGVEYDLILLAPGVYKIALGINAGKAVTAFRNAYEFNLPGIDLMSRIAFGIDAPKHVKDLGVWEGTPVAVISIFTTMFTGPDSVFRMEVLRGGNDGSHIGLCHRKCPVAFQGPPGREGCADEHKEQSYDDGPFRFAQSGLTAESFFHAFRALSIAGCIPSS